MKKILFTLLVAIGVMMSASAQPVDMNAVIKKTAEQVCLEKKLPPQKKDVIEEILQQRMKENRDINAKKLPPEKKKEEMQRLNDKTTKMLDEKVAPNIGKMVLNKFNSNRNAAAEAAKKK